MRFLLDGVHSQTGLLTDHLAPVAEERAGWSRSR